MQSLDLNKKINIIFSSYWDANELLSAGKIYTSVQNNSVLEIDLSSKEDIKICSISISSPPKDKIPNLHKPPVKIENVTCLNPEYLALSKYKQDHDFADFSKKYIENFHKNLPKIKSFLKNIVHKNIFLNCWENTSENVHCHRRLVFDILAQSPAVLKRFNLIYRHGNKRNYPDTIVASETIERHNLW